VELLGGVIAHAPSQILYILNGIGSGGKNEEDGCHRSRVSVRARKHLISTAGVITFNESFTVGKGAGNEVIKGCGDTIGSQHSHN